MKFLRLASSIVLLSVWAISAQGDTKKYEKCFDSVLKSFMGLERELSVRGKPVNFTIDGHDCAATLTTSSGGDPLKMVCPMLVPHGPRCINILGDGGTAIFSISCQVCQVLKFPLQKLYTKCVLSFFAVRFG